LNNYPDNTDTGNYSNGYQQHPYPQQPYYPPPQHGYPMPAQYPPQQPMPYPYQQPMYPQQQMMMPQQPMPYQQPMYMPQTNVNVNIGYQQKQQLPAIVRILYFLFIGMYLGMFWAGFALFLCCTIIGLPLGILMFNQLPAVMTLKM
jgi:hypothetical protein